MKIRLDYVTNSSSVSYIVSMNPDMAEFGHVKNGLPVPGSRAARIYATLRDDLKQSGEKLAVGDNEVLQKVYHFEKKPQCKYDSSFGVPIEQVDFASLSDQDLWSYIYGECLVNGRLAAEFKGFGSLQIPRDRKRLALKLWERISCDTCERKDTPDCNETVRKAKLEKASS